MELVQIGTICPDDVVDLDNRSFLENLCDSENVNFVEALDGEASSVKEFSQDIIPWKDILDDEEYGNFYIALCLRDYPDDFIQKLKSNRSQSKTKLLDAVLLRPVD